MIKTHKYNTTFSRLREEIVLNHIEQEELFKITALLYEAGTRYAVNTNDKRLAKTVEECRLDLFRYSLPYVVAGKTTQDKSKNMDKIVSDVKASMLELQKMLDTEGKNEHVYQIE